MRPHREPPLRIWVIQNWSAQLLSQTTTTSTQEARHKAIQDQPLNRGIGTKPTQSHLTRGIGTKPKITPQSPLYLEGYQQTITSTLRGIPKVKKDYNSW